jgi:hypothetical protein
MAHLLRDRLLVTTAALLLAVASAGIFGAAAQLGRPFPGFLLLENRVVASVGLSIWPATAGGEIFQREVVAVDERRVSSARGVHEAVSRVPVGTVLRYDLHRAGRTERREFATRHFGARDFVLLYGMYLVNGLALGAAGLVALAVRRRNSAAVCAAPALLLGSLWTLSALDLYGPYRLFALHALCEALLFSAALHMALGFPQPTRLLARNPWLPVLLYGAGFVLGGFYLIRLQQPGAYSGTHLVAVSAFGVALFALVVSELERFRHSLSVEARVQLRTIAAGAVLAFGMPICLMLAELLTGGRSPANAPALTAWIFPASVAYAVVRGELGWLKA